jgi:hypothetical protein
MMRHKRVMGYQEQLQRIVEDYITAGEPWPATSRDIAAWGIKTERWHPRGSDLVEIFADQIARAMREEYIVDPQGRHVRAKHAARVKKGPKQLVLWADIRTASRRHMEIAFQQRRQQIVGDCRQLRLDVDSFNENKNTGRPIQMVFDFSNDLLEADLAATSVHTAA